MGQRASSSKWPGWANQRPYSSAIAAGPRHVSRQLGTVASRVAPGAYTDSGTPSPLVTAARKASTTVAVVVGVVLMRPPCVALVAGTLQRAQPIWVRSAA